MSINLYLLQVKPQTLDSLKKDEKLLLKKINTALKNEVPSNQNSFKTHYAGLGIFSVEDYIEKNPYVNTLAPELKKDALKRLKKVFGGNADFEKILSLDKAWHGIHFLLSGEVWSGGSLMSGILMGGTENFNSTPENPKYHEAEKVKEISGNLPDLEELKKRFEPEKMKAAGIYAFDNDDSDDDWDYLSYFYSQMLLFFKDAAVRENAVLLYTA